MDRRNLYTFIVRVKLYDINRQISQIIENAACEGDFSASRALDCSISPGEGPAMQTPKWTLAKHLSEGLLSTPACKEIDTFDDVQQFVREAADTTYAQLPLELLIWDFLTSFLGRPTSDLLQGGQEHSSILLRPESQEMAHSASSAFEAANLDETEKESYEKQLHGRKAVSKITLLPAETTHGSRASSSMSKYSRSTFESDQSPPLSTSDPLSIVYDMYAASSSPPISAESVDINVPPSIGTEEISPILRTGMLTRSVELHGVGSMAQQSHTVVVVHSLDTSIPPSILKSDVASTGGAETALPESPIDAIASRLIREPTKPSSKRLQWTRWSKTSKYRLANFLDMFTANKAIEKGERSMQSRSYNRTFQHTLTTFGR